MPFFYPFNKPIGQQLDETDLNELTNQKVAEGYYVEYKGDTFPASNKIGNSIAALANTDGGCYIIGVKTDNTNVAQDICGFDLATYSDPIAKIREIIKTHIDPIPRFYARVVSLSTSVGKAVLVVYVPPKQDTPFVTKDGRIYRRTHDSSNPIPENNRGAIDRLIDEGQRARQRFERFCEDERSFSRSESNGDIGWLNIFIQPYAYEAIDRTDLTSTGNLETFLVESRSRYKIPVPYELSFESAIPFDSAQPTVDSIIMRQTNWANVAFNSMTVELFFDGRAKFHVPISYLKFESFNSHWKKITSEQVKNLLSEIGVRSSPTASANFLKFFEMSLLWNTVTVLSAFYLRCLKDITPISFKVAIKLTDIWRAVPLVDSDEWAAHVRRIGLPVSLSSDKTFPQNVGNGYVFDFDESYRLGFSLFELIAFAFGLPYEMHAQTVLHFIRTSIEASNQVDKD